MITAMIAQAITPHPAQAATSEPHTPVTNVTPTSEVPIGASILWAFLLTATHNLTLPEHSTLSFGLQHSVPETTLAPQEVYSTPQPQLSAMSPAGVSQPLPQPVPWTKSSITEFTLEPSRTKSALSPPLPQELQPTPLVFQDTQRSPPLTEREGSAADMVPSVTPHTENVHLDFPLVKSSVRTHSPARDSGGLPSRPTRASLPDAVFRTTVMQSLASLYKPVIMDTALGAPQTTVTPPWTVESLETNSAGPNPLNDQLYVTDVEQADSEELESVLVVSEGNGATEQLPRKGGRTAGQNRNSLMARLIDDRGGTTLSGGNTVWFSSNGRLLAEPRTISVNTQISDGSERPPALLGDPSTHESPDEAQDSLAVQPHSGESEGSPEILTISLVTQYLSGEVEGSPEPSPEPLTYYFVPEAEGSLEPPPEPLTTYLVPEVKDSSEPAPESLLVFIVPEVEGSSQPPPEPLTTHSLPEVEGSSEPAPEPLTTHSSPEVEGSSEPPPEPLTTRSVPEAEDSPEPAAETFMASPIPVAKGSLEPPTEPLTAFLVASQLSGEAETLTGSSAAAGQVTPDSAIPTTPAGCSTSSQQPPDEECSHSAALQASESSGFLSEPQETNETVNDTAGAEAVETSRGSGIQWSTFKVVMFVVQFVIMVETVFGNLMVILSVKMEKKLQTPFNYYIVNLAFTDMNVGISVMSLFMIYNLYDYFPFNAALCHYWVWSDYTMTFESVMTLAAISIDRLWSVTWSLHYRNHNSTRKSLYIILGTWCLVAVIWLPPFLYDRAVNVYGDGDCYWDAVLNKNLVVYVGFLGYYMPLLVMLGAYAKILLVVRKRAASIRDAGRKPSIQADPSSGGGGGGGGGGGDQKRLVAGAAATQPKDDKQEQKLKREMKAVYTLLNIVVIFLLCWVPFYILFVLSAWFPTLFPPWYVTFSYWMAYINSAVNPILYPLSSPEFRQAYKKVILVMIGRA